MNISMLSKALPHRFNLVSIAAVIGIAAAISLPEIGRAAPAPASSASNALAWPVSDGWLAQMRQAGMRGDRSQIRRMVEIFQNPPGSAGIDVAHNTRLVLLRPLAQLDATEALPALEAVIQSDPFKPFPPSPYAEFEDNQEVIAASKVVKARILAQSNVQGVTDNQARASAEVKRFFQELGQTPESLNTVVASYKAADRQHLEATHYNPDYRSDVVPVELFAMRELADMAYRDRYRGFASLPDVARVDFKQDDGSALKVRLAPLPREQRIAVLVNELDELRPAKNLDGRRAQLLADEGPAALPVIAVKTQDFKAHPGQYRKKLGGQFGENLGCLSVLVDTQKRITDAADDDAAAKPQVSGEEAHAAYPQQFAPAY